MSRMKVSLPDFEDPPVVEVALAVQFEPLAKLRTPQIGLLWNQFRERFPKIEEHQPLNPVVEQFGLKGPPTSRVRVEMVQRPTVPRCWFVNESGTELIQVQQDRFAHNWRKTGQGEAYPRYEQVRKTFKDELRVFQDFLALEAVGELLPNQAEVTYVNHIIADGGWQHHGQLANVFALFAGTCCEGSLPDLEEARVSGSYVIPGAQGEPLGRLRFSVDPVYVREDDRPAFLLKLVARGRPNDEGVDGILDFLDVGRKWVVRAFAAVTTKTMHRIWGRRDEH